MTRNEFRFVGRLSVISISRMFGLFMVLPVMALWADDFADATPLLVGIAVGGYGVTQALLQIPYGAISDRIGRKPVLVFGLSVFLVGSVIAALAQTIDGVIVGRLLQGAGAVSATLSAWLADRTREVVRTPAMAVFGAAIGASFLLALVFGPLLSAAVGVRGLFWFSAVLGGLAVLLVLTDRHPSPATAQRSAPRQWRWSAVMRPELLVLDAAVLLLHAALTGFFVLAPYLLIDRIGWAADEHWKLYTITLAASLPVAIPMIMRDGRSRGTTFLLPSLALLVAGFGLIWASGGSVWLFGIGCSGFFAGFSYLEASLPAEISRRADPEQRGACLGLFSSAQFFGAFVGAAIAGWFVGGWGAQAGMLALTALLAAWLAGSGIKTLQRAA